MAIEHWKFQGEDYYMVSKDGKLYPFCTVKTATQFSQRETVPPIFHGWDKMPKGFTKVGDI